MQREIKPAVRRQSQGQEVGDATSWAAPVEWVARLARTHARWLAGAARAEGLGAADALDAVQEALLTFLSLPEARELEDRDADARAYLGAIVRNEARNMRRRHHHARPHDSFDDAGEPADRLPPVDELLARAEERARALRCVRTLRDVHRRVIELRVLEELDAPEAAARLGLQRGHVAVLLHRAKQELARCLERLPAAAPAA